MKKGIKILLTLFVIQTFISCCKDVEFLDYSTIEVEEFNEFVEINENLKLTIRAEDVEYMSSLATFGHNTAIAHACEDGWGGMKHPIIDILIISNSDFDSLHLAGTSLSDIFEYEEFIGRGEYETHVLTDIDNYSATVIDLTLPVRPELSNDHLFTILLTKSNGDVLEATTNPINWE